MSPHRPVPFPSSSGASAADPAECIRHAEIGARHGAACLVAVPAGLYGDAEGCVGFFRKVGESAPVPVVVQDLQFNGPGLPIDVIRRMWEEVPAIAGFKIETVPAGPKYTAVREFLGPDVWISGGWAVPQMIEALDRGVDAMVPEASMVRVYAAVYRMYRSGDRDGAASLFRRLLPVLSYTNQEFLTSIAFFKRLLVRRGVFSTEYMRKPGFARDAYNTRVADELIALEMALEAETSHLQTA